MSENVDIEELLRPVPEMVPISEVTKLQARLEDRAMVLAAVRSDLQNLRTDVRKHLVGLVNNGSIGRIPVNEVLEALGLEVILPTFKVVVKTSGGDHVLTVSNVEAKDGDAAVEKMSEDTFVTVTASSLEYSISYIGKGTEDDRDDWTDHSPDIDLSEFGDAWLQSLEISAEEE